MALKAVAFGLVLGLVVAEASKEKCQDLDSRCSYWVKKGECERNFEFMKRNCKKSCMMCEEAVLKGIVDNAERQTLYMTMLLAGVLGGLVLAIVRAYFAGASCSSLAKLHGKTVIVTGANRGIGRETALSFAGRGAKVILACRSYKTGLQALKYIRDISESKLVEFKKLDLTSFESIREFAREINEEEERIDVLVNNAGVLAGSEREVTKDGHELMLQVNYLGRFLLTNLLLEKMKKSAPSRIVNIAGSIYEKSKGFDFKNMEMETGYDRFKQVIQTNLATMLFNHELSKRLEGSGITANALHPGLVNTVFEGNGGILELRIVKLLLFPIKALFFKTPRQGAQTSIYVSVAKELDGISGKYFKECKESEIGLCAKDDGAAKKLWEISEGMTKLT